MSLTPEGLSFIKSWEGYRESVYLCAAGILTIGYGHAILTEAGKKKYHKGYKLSLTEAEALLNADMAKFEYCVDHYVKAPITLRQRDALVSFCFNVGIGAFVKSTLLRKLNAQDYVGASSEFPRWCRGGTPSKIIEGLSRRREAERRVFIADIPKSKQKGLMKLHYNMDLTPVPLGPEYVRIARCA